MGVETYIFTIEGALTRAFSWDANPVPMYFYYMSVSNLHLKLLSSFVFHYSTYCIFNHLFYCIYFEYLNKAKNKNTKHIPLLFNIDFLNSAQDSATFDSCQKRILNNASFAHIMQCYIRLSFEAFVSTHDGRIKRRNNRGSEIIRNIWWSIYFIQ